MTNVSTSKLNELFIHSVDERKDCISAKNRNVTSKPPRPDQNGATKAKQNTTARIRSESAKNGASSTNTQNGRRRPQSAKESVTSKTQLVKTRPQSAKETASHSDSTDSPLAGSGPILKPFVYGFSSGKPVYGEETRPAKVEDVKVPDLPVQRQNPPKQLSSRVIPSCLEPLRAWITEGVPGDLVGVSSVDCLMFLPSLQKLQDLPVVPPSQTLGDDLAYLEKIEEPKPWKPKKYKHPFKIVPIEDWNCKHSSTKVAPLRILAEDGSVLHETRQGRRTAAVVRREIRELADLLKGIGTETSSCSVVQYQSEINDLQSQIKKTLPRVEEIERREYEKWKRQQPSDICGLRAFYKDHDQVIAQIKEQHKKCVRELAALEAAIMDTENRHFSKPES